MTGGVIQLLETSVPSGDRRLRAALALPDREDPAPGVVVIHEIFGLNDDVRRIAARLAELGYAALAPHLLDGRGPRPLCMARTMRDLREGAGTAFDDLEAARAFLAARPEVDGERLGVVGFCMGGSFALLLAPRGGYRAAGVFYGEVPESADALEGACPILGGYGARDRVFGPKAPRLEAHLTALGVPHDVRVYPEAGHSYMNQGGGLMARLSGLTPMKVGFAPAAAEDSWRRLEAFFGTHLAGA